VELVARGAIRPDIVLADYNLPNGMDGLQLAAKLREDLHHPIPIVVLTGDISTETLRNIASRDYVQLTKPVKLKVLTQVIQSLLPKSQSAALSRASEMPARSAEPVIFVVDDDSELCESVCAVLRDDGRIAEAYPTSEAFLEAYRPNVEACLLIDAYLPGMSGIELLQRLSERGWRLPSIMITGKSDVAIAVQAMKAGATDFIEKPINRIGLLASIDRALERSQDSRKLFAWREAAADHIARLTVRERDVMMLVLAGRANKNIAVDLGISQRTVENHRASIMRKTGSNSLPALARLALAAGWSRVDETSAKFGN